MDLFTGIQQSINIAQQLSKLSKKVGEAEFSMLVADLQLSLADNKVETANLKIEMAGYLDKIRELEEQLKIKIEDKPEFKNGGYNFPNDPLTYCTACYDSQGKKIKLNEVPQNMRTFGRWVCPICRGRTV